MTRLSRAVTIFESSLGRENAATVAAMFNLADYRAAAGHPAMARASLRDIVGICDKGGLPSAICWWADHGLAVLVDDEEAIPILERLAAVPALEQRQAHLAGLVRFELAQRTYETGDVARAVELVREAQSLIEARADDQEDWQEELAKIAAWQEAHDLGPHD